MLVISTKIRKQNERSEMKYSNIKKSYNIIKKEEIN